MKRHFVFGLVGSILGLAVLLVLLDTTGIAGARSVEIGQGHLRANTIRTSTLFTSTFTYQGQLKQGSNGVNGVCQLAFRLYDDPTSSLNLIGNPLTLTVPISNGLFSVGLNFGSVFDGSGRWLDVQVNCGSGFFPLTPRQALTPAPYASYATQAGRLPWGASWIGGGTGTGLSVQGGEVGLLGNGSAYGVQGQTDVTTGKGVFGLATATGGHADGVYGETQSPDGSGVVGINASTSGGVGVFGQNDASNGFGLFGYTAAGTGVQGLSDGPGGKGGYFSNSTAGPGLVAQSAQGNSIEAYAGSDRKFYVDNLGRAYAAGSVPLLPRALAPMANTTTTLDSAGDVGRYTSLSIGADGLPVISYHDRTSSDLKIAHCNDAACTSAITTTLDPGGVSGITGQSTSLGIGADGLPVISYWDFEGTKGALKVAHCNNLACTSAISTTLDSSGNVGQFTSLSIGVDGLAVISYWSTTSQHLKVAHCNNMACTSAISTTLDSSGHVGQFTSLSIGADGLPVISYFDNTNEDLKVAHCNDVACTSAISTTLDTGGAGGSVGLFTSITVGADGLPVISYHDATNGSLKAAHCNNVACTSAISTTLDTGGASGSVGQYSSITIGADGLPVISYYDATNGDLKIAHCNDAACTNAITTAPDTGGASGNVGWETSISIGADGLPVMSYYDVTNGDLKVLHCSNPLCVPYFRRR